MEPRDARLHVLLVGEGDLSHGAFVRRIGDGLGRRPGVTIETHVIDAPRGPWARLIAPVPRLGDLDLQPLRWRLRYSWHARRALGASADVALVNTQSVALLAAGPMRRTPTVLSVDATGRQFAALEYWRPRSRAALASELPLEALERRALRRAARVLAWTEWTARSLREDYGLPSERIAVVHPGVDVARWSVERAASAAPADRLRILFVGNHAWRKGLRTLLSALPLVERQLELHVVSGDATLDVPAGVVVHRGLAPGSDGLKRRLAEADVFVLPTRADMAPWAIIEAMAAGLPVVASDVAAIPELLGEAGEVVPPDDPAALAAALRALADDPGRRAELGARASARAHEHYAQEHQLERILDVLRAARERPLEAVA
jgi:glycosyltransferase involved in cell wall biosynthesis